MDKAVFFPHKLLLHDFWLWRKSCNFVNQNFFGQFGHNFLENMLLLPILQRNTSWETCKASVAC